jgi:N-hydroxyarylamine O-acetyltransferase
MTTTDHPTFDLAAYLARIGVPGPAAPDLETLRALHLAHVTHIPFENLDIHLGRPIRLDLASLQAKLVSQRRGGYCFEQNSLFQHALLALGFDVDACEARVRSDAAGAVRPRTHMVLVVRLQEDDWLCDVGFGAGSLLHPLLIDGEEHLQFGRHLRVVVEESALVLQSRAAHEWFDEYVFDPEPVHPIDFEVGNWFTSTHPDSRFVTTVTAQRVFPDARHVLRQLTYTVMRGSDVETREIDRSDLPRLLREVFEIDVPDDVRLKGLDG